MPISLEPPSTDIEIISNAMRLCGKQGINSIETKDPFAESAAAFYGLLVNAEFGSNRWKFTEKSEELSNPNTLAPTFEGWQYYWEMPADLVMLLRLDPFVPYTVFGDRILTAGNSPLTAIYTRKVEVTDWSNPFKMYITYALADMLAMSVTTSDRMVGAIGAAKSAWYTKALFADGQSSPPRSIRSQPWITTRYASGFGSRSRWR